MVTLRCVCGDKELFMCQDTDTLASLVVPFRGQTIDIITKEGKQIKCIVTSIRTFFNAYSPNPNEKTPVDSMVTFTVKRIRDRPPKKCNKSIEQPHRSPE